MASSTKHFDWLRMALSANPLPNCHPDGFFFTKEFPMLLEFIRSEGFDFIRQHTDYRLSDLIILLGFEVSSGKFAQHTHIQFAIAVLDLSKELIQELIDFVFIFLIQNW